MAVLLAPLLAYAALPLVLRFAVPEMLAARGLPASVGWGYLDLRDLDLVLSDLRIGSPDGPGLEFGEVRADLVRSALVEGRIELTNLRLRGASLDLDSLEETRMAVPGAGVPFEEVQLEDLNLPGLSEKLGSRVVVRHARLHRGPEGDEAALLLEADVDAGGAPLELRGRLDREGAVERLEGTLNASGVPARLFDPASAGAPSAWSGLVYVATEFELLYERPARRASLRATGSLHTAGAGLRLGKLTFAQADTVWDGTLTLSGPAFARPERVYFQGTLDAAAARVADAGGSASTVVSGLHWEGIGGWHGVPVAAGKGRAESILFERSAPETAPLRVDLERIELKASLEDAGRYRLDHLRVRNARAELPVPETEIRLQSLEVRELHGASGSVRIEQVSASGLEALAGGEAGAWRFSVERPRLAHVALTPEARASVADAALESLVVDAPDLGVTALGARMESLHLDPAGPWRAGLASFEVLEHSGGGRRIRVRDLRGEALLVARDGALDAEQVSAARVAGSGPEGESWTAQGLGAGRLRFRSGAAEAGVAELGTLVYRGGEGVALEGGGLRARSLSLRPEGGEAERLEADSLRYDVPRGPSWESRAVSLAEARWQAMGPRSARRVVLADLRYRGVGGERWRFDALELDSATLGREGEVAVENALAERAALDLPSGAVLEAQHLRSGTAEGAPGDSTRLSALEADTLSLRAPTGLAWRAFPVTFDSLVVLDGARVDAHRLRSGALSLHDGEGGRWQASGIAARLLQWHGPERRLRADPLDLEGLEFAAAGGIAWRADDLLAGAFEWPLGRLPSIRHASAAALEGSAAHGLRWRLEDLQATGDALLVAGSSRFRVLSAGAGHLASDAQDSRFSWSGLRATDLELTDAERFGAERVVFGDVSLSGGGLSGASIVAARLEIVTLERERGRLAAETLLLDDSVAALGVTEAGEWMLPTWPGAARAPALGAMAIGELDIAGHNRAVFVDRGMEPPWEVEVEPYRLRVIGLDSADAKRPARFEVDGRLDASARLYVSGELRPAPQGFDARARVRLKDLDLHRLSGYARRHLGVSLRAGQGDIDLALELSAGEIDAAGDLRVRDLALDPVPAAGAAGTAFAAEIGRLAGSGKAFGLPVSLSGPIADPDFDLPAAAGLAIARSAGLGPGGERAETLSDSEAQ